MSTEEQMSMEDRVRTATRAGASLIRDVRPLAEPALVRLRRRPEPGPRRWVNWGVPLAAAAAVAAIALTLVAVRQPGHPPPAGSVTPAASASATATARGTASPTASTSATATASASATAAASATATASGTAGPATIPRYYVYASPGYNHQAGDGPLTVGDDLTGTVIDSVSPPPGLVFSSVWGASDDRTFVAQAVADTIPGGPPPYTWYLLRIAPGSTLPHQLTKLPIKLPGNAQTFAYALSPDGRELAVSSAPADDNANDSDTLGIYSVSTGAELRAWTTPISVAVAIGGDTFTWLPGGQELVFDARVRTAGSAYDSQLRSLDVTGTGTNLMAGSRALFTVDDIAGAPACMSLHITPDGKTAICATQYGALTGTASKTGCANGGLKFTAFPLPAARPSRLLYQYRGACSSGETFMLWTDASASSIIGVTWVNPHNVDGKEALQIGDITGGHFRALNIGQSVFPESYPGLVF